MINKSYFRYWGKAREDSYHPLVYHCLDVAAVGQELVRQYPLCQRLHELLALDLNSFINVFTFFLTLHDLGKFSAAFQSLRTGLPSHLVGQGSDVLYERRIRYDVRHDSLGLLLWRNELRQWEYLEALWKDRGGEDLCKEIVEQWIKIVTGHHGVPPTRSRGKNGSTETHFNPIDIESVKEFLIDIKEIGFFPNQLPDLFFKEEYKEVLALSSWELNGVAVLADWLGSDAEVFQYHPEQMSLDQYWHEHAIVKAARVVEKAELNHRIYPNSIVNPHKIFGYLEKLTSLQQYCAEVKFSNQPQLFILEDVTGSGKTEAALILAQRLMSESLAEGLYIGLPTMATANAMYGRIKDFYHRLFSSDCKPSLILSHSKSRICEKFNEIGRQAEDDDYFPGEETASYWCNRWFADNRKKNLLADVAVGTLDQALLSVLPVKHQTLRQLGLASKVLIADEIHAYDEYTGALLGSLLTSYAQKGGSAILLSATLPQKIRKKLVDAFQQGLRTEFKIKHPYQSAAEALPRITHIDGKNAVVSKSLPDSRPPRRIEVVLVNDEPDIYEIIRQAIAADRCVCWIRNTVDSAIKAYRFMEENMGFEKTNLRLFHSRFAMIDRLRIEEEVIKHFGKDSGFAQRAGQVLIATQVVEQSLDLDFDLLISDLGPIDLLIQRAGRLQRHQRDVQGNLTTNPSHSKRNQPVLSVYGPVFEPNPSRDWLNTHLPGTEYVYNPCFLWLTQRLLSDYPQIEIPKDLPGLIEGVYGEIAQNIPDNLRSLWEEAEGANYSQRDLARFNELMLTKGYCEESAQHNGWSDEVDISTRLGDKTEEVILMIADGNEFHAYAQDNAFPWDMSTINFRLHEIEKLNHFSRSLTAKIEQMKKQHPQLKNYRHFVPLVKTENNNCYELLEPRPDSLVQYSSKFGFLTHKLK